ncbi:transposase [Clostridium sp. JNZ X4-2]
MRALDRGFDDKKFYRYFINSNEPFVIRAKCNRNVIHNGKSINILKLANKYHGRFSTIVRNKAGKAKKCKFSFIPIALPDIPYKSLTLVVIRGFGKVPMMLISSIKPDDKRLTLTIIQVYLKRWRIEEYFRFKKQQFDFENIRVRSLNSIRTMNLVLSLIVGFIAMISKKKGRKYTEYINTKAFQSNL